MSSSEPIRCTFGGFLKLCYSECSASRKFVGDSGPSAGAGFSTTRLFSFSQPDQPSGSELSTRAQVKRMLEPLKERGTKNRLSCFEGKNAPKSKMPEDKTLHRYMAAQ